MHGWIIEKITSTDGLRPFPFVLFEELLLFWHLV